MSLAFIRAPLATLCVTLACAALPRGAHAQPSYADSAEWLVIAAHQQFDAHTPESLERSIALFQLALGELRAPEHLHRAAGVLNTIGVAHRARGRTDSALVYLGRALDLRRQVGDRTGEGNTLYNLGVVFLDRSRADSALAHYRASLAIRRELRDPPAEAVVLAAIGTTYSLLSRGDSAAPYLARALALARELGDRPAEATALEFTGSMHQALGRADSAAFYFAAALEIRRELGDPARAMGPVVSKASLPTGENRDSVLVRLHGMLDTARAFSDPRREAVVLDLIGAVHHDAGRADSALAYQGQVLALHRAMGDQRSEGVTLSHIAAAHAARGRADSALAYYRWALPILRATGDRREEGSVLVNVGVLHHNAGTRAGLARAVAYYDSADAVLAAVGRSAGGDEGRLSIAEMNAPLFDSWALAWLLRDGRRGAGRAADAALAASERGRAQVLRDLMRRRDAAVLEGRAGPPHPGPGEDLPAEGRALAWSVSRGGAPALSYVATDRTLLVFLVLPDSRVEVFRTLVTADSLAALVARVRDGMVADSAEGRPRSAGAGARPGVAAVFPDSAKPVDDGAWRAPATVLSELLFPQGLRDRLPPAGELVIVPSGPLALLPFAVLPVHDDVPLGLRYALRYAPSLQVLAELEARPGDPLPVQGALVVGNPDMPDSLRLDPLKSAESEAAWVAERLGTRHLTGPAATEAAVRERMATASLVHLATHALAYASTSHARESYIVLGRDTREDGILTVGEVLDELPDMRAELVVLSACQTGLGGLNQAEGTLGFQRAFLARGARGVLVSQWSVDDAPTALLMQEFYANWIGGLSKAEALRHAQIAVAKVDPRPRSWAAFQMVGGR